jgi:hypothetical protein
LESSSSRCRILQYGPPLLPNLNTSAVVRQCRVDPDQGNCESSALQ